MKTKEKSERLTIGVSVDKESYEVVNGLCKEVGQSFSWIVDTYLQSMALTIKGVRKVKGGRLTKLDMLKLVISGASHPPC
jgi:hypothetical protein